MSFLPPDGRQCVFENPFFSCKIHCKECFHDGCHTYCCHSLGGVLGVKWWTTKLLEFTLQNALGNTILKSRGLFTRGYWYWIGVAALIGYMFLFNFIVTFALQYFSRKCSSLDLRHYVLCDQALHMFWLLMIIFSIVWSFVTGRNFGDLLFTMRVCTLFDQLWASRKH